MPCPTIKLDLKKLWLCIVIYDNGLAINFCCLYRKRKELMESIKGYKPTVNSVSQVRVLLIGPVGAGKSSFFNSINSIYRGHVTSQAIAGSSTTSLTTQVSSCLLMISICSQWFQIENPAPSPFCDLLLHRFVHDSFGPTQWKLDAKENLCQSSCVTPWDWRKAQGWGLI